MRSREYHQHASDKLVDVVDFNADPARLERILASDRWDFNFKGRLGVVEMGAIEDKGGHVRVEYENSGIYYNRNFKGPTRNITVRLFDVPGNILLTVNQAQFWNSKRGTIERSLSVGPSLFKREDGDNWADRPFIYQFQGFPFGADGKMNPTFRAKGLPRIIDMEATVSAFIDQILSGRFSRPEIIRPKRKRVDVTP